MANHNKVSKLDINPGIFRAVATLTEVLNHLKLSWQVLKKPLVILVKRIILHSTFAIHK